VASGVVKEEVAASPEVVKGGKKILCPSKPVLYSWDDGSSPLNTNVCHLNYNLCVA